MSDPAEHGTPAAPEAVAAGDARTPLLWSVNPWRRNPAQAGTALLITAVIAALIFSAALPILVALVLTTALALSLAPAWMVIRCRVDEQGVGRALGGIWTRRHWSEIRRAEIETHVRAPELFVSPQEKPGPLDAFRGLHLPLPLEPAERTRLTAGIQERLTARGARR